tara:strand:+ start:576 stop:866 length:291 start_codon:yes stop_codon:yes gene_type:complete
VRIIHDENAEQSDRWLVEEREIIERFKRTFDRTSSFDSNPDTCSESKSHFDVVINIEIAMHHLKWSCGEQASGLMPSPWFWPDAVGRQGPDGGGML